MIVIIIDFDNYFTKAHLNSVSLEFELKQLLSLCEANFQSFSNVRIRLYGGWHKDQSFSKLASKVQQLLYEVEIFPKVVQNKVINGTVELTSSLFIKPEYTWCHTYKETNGVPRIRINHDTTDELCKCNRTTCPKFLLHKITESKNRSCGVEGCTHLQKNIFKGAEQKMVDTLIACDIISIIESEDTKGILVISDDQDHFPSLALASLRQSKQTAPIMLGIRNEMNMELASHLLAPFNIKTIKLDDIRRN